MTKAEKILKAMDERDAARQNAAPEPATAPAPTGPNKYEGMNRDKTTMRLDRITFDIEQPRKEFDEKKMADLAATMRSHGVITPVLLRWIPGVGFWQVVAGERRVRAVRDAGLTDIPARFEDDLSRDEIDEIQIIENIHRDELKPSEKADWIRRYIGREPGRTQRQIAEKVRLSESSISEILAATELPGPLLALVDAGVIPIKVGAELAKITDDVEQAQVAERIVAGRMSRDDAMAEVKAKRPKKKKHAARPRPSRTVRLKLDDGYVITITGPTAIIGDEAVRVLRLAIERLEGQGRAAA